MYYTFYTFIMATLPAWTSLHNNTLLSSSLSISLSAVSISLFNQLWKDKSSRHHFCCSLIELQAVQHERKQQHTTFIGTKNGDTVAWKGKYVAKNGTFYDCLCSNLSKKYVVIIFFHYMWVLEEIFLNFHNLVTCCLASDRNITSKEKYTLHLLQ